MFSHEIQVYKFVRLPVADGKEESIKLNLFDMPSLLALSQLCSCFCLLTMPSLPSAEKMERQLSALQERADVAKESLDCNLNKQAELESRISALQDRLERELRDGKSRARVRDHECLCEKHVVPFSNLQGPAGEQKARDVKDAESELQSLRMGECGIKRDYRVAADSRCPLTGQHPSCSGMTGVTSSMRCGDNEQDRGWKAHRCLEVLGM